MGNEIAQIFDESTIEYYKKNKSEITSELLQQLRSIGNQGKQIALDILDTETNDDNYYLDAFGSPIAFRGDRELKRAYTKMKLADIHIEELQKCASSLDYFRENYVKIRTKDGVNFPELREYQAGFLKALTSDYESIISLQPRQSGKSVTTAIYLTWKFVFDNDKVIGICANDGGLAAEFLKHVKNIFCYLPMWMKVGIKTWNGGTIESENEMRVLTDGPSKDSFRGYTVNLLVVDETAFISTSLFREFIDSVGPSQSALAWKKSIFISTANGMNHFYEMVRDSKKRKEYKDLDDTKHAKILERHKGKILSDEKNSNGLWDVTVDEPSNGYFFYEVSWRDVPRFSSDGKPLDPDEFKERTVDKYGLVYFNQNYGNEFLGSSYTLINQDILKAMESKEPDIIWDTYLNIYDPPVKKHKYIMGVDPAKGANDAYAIQIIDITVFPFKLVASAQIFKCNYQIMPAYLSEWGTRYNKAFMIIENNEGAGTFAASMLELEYEYENLYYEMNNNKPKREAGFRTSSKSRTQMLETFKFFTDGRKLEIYDSRTINELRTFIIKDNKYQADDGYHDDMVMALALCFVPFIDNKNFDNMRELIEKIYSQDNLDIDVTDYMIVGDFDDFSDGSEDDQYKIGSRYDSESQITGVIKAY